MRFKVTSTSGRLPERLTGEISRTDDGEPVLVKYTAIVEINTLEDLARLQEEANHSDLIVDFDTYGEKSPLPTIEIYDGYKE
jgi:hypothetical protein